MKLCFSFLVFALWALVCPSRAAPTLVIQGDKTYQFYSVVVSNGEKWIASSDSGGGNIKIFDGKNGLQWGEFPAASGASPLRFTPDVTRILTTKARDAFNGDQSQVSLCEVPTGRKLRSFAVSPYPVWCDNTRLRGFRNGALIEFDLKTGRENFAREIEDAPQGGRYGPRFSFSENGAWLVEGSAGVIRFWKAQSGQLIGRIEDRLRAIGTTAISDDGKWLASVGDDPEWKPPTDGPMTESAYTRTSRLHVWNARTRKLIRTFYRSLGAGLPLLEFSPDARTLFGTGEGGLDRFNIASGKNALLPPPQKDFRKGMGGPLNVSGDGLWLAGVGQIYQSSDFGPGLQLWSLPTSRLRARFGGTLRGVSQVKWSPDGKYLAGGDRLTLWDARSGKLLAEKPGSYIYDFVWVNATTIRSQTLGRMQIWSAPDLKLKSDFRFSPAVKGGSLSDEYSGGLSIAPDGRTILTTATTPLGSDLNSELWVWDVASKKLLRKIKTEKDSWGYTEFSQVVWLPDNRRVVFGTQSKLVLLDTQTGVVEKERGGLLDPNFEVGPSYTAVIPLRVSPDGKWLAATNARDGKTLIFDLTTFALDPAAGLEWWETASAKARKLRAAGAPEGEGALSPDGSLMAFGADSIKRNGVSIWNVVEGREVVRFYLPGGNSESTSLDWIALTPAGFYNASPAGEKRLRWREGKAFWPLAKSRARFKRPDFVVRALKPRD